MKTEEIDNNSLIMPRELIERIARKMKFTVTEEMENRYDRWMGTGQWKTSELGRFTLNESLIAALRQAGFKCSYSTGIKSIFMYAQNGGGEGYANRDYEKGGLSFLTVYAVCNLYREKIGVECVPRCKGSVDFYCANQDFHNGLLKVLLDHSKPRVPSHPFLQSVRDASYRFVIPWKEIGCDGIQVVSSLFENLFPKSEKDLWCFVRELLYANEKLLTPNQAVESFIRKENQEKLLRQWHEQLLRHLLNEEMRQRRWRERLQSFKKLQPMAV